MSKSIAERVEALEGDIPQWLVLDAFEAVFPEPPPGPWYWRNSVWKKWDFAYWHVMKAAQRKDWLYILGWLWRGKMPEMIHSDPKKAIAAALRAQEAHNG